MKNILYILCSFIILSCATSKKMGENQLIAVLKNPNDLAKAEEMINNSGIHWNKLAHDKKGVKIGLIEVPKEQKKFWLERLSQSGMFKDVKPYCKKTLKKIVKKEEKNLLSFWKTPCRGNCPYYDLIITKDGKGTFINKKAKEIKKQEFHLSEIEFNTLKKKLAAKNFTEFEKVYDNPKLADLPSSYINYIGNQIHIRYWKNVPEELISIEKYLEQLLITNNLIK